MATFRANDAGIRAMAATSEMGDAMRQLAERVAARARAIAPVDTGLYQASFEVSVVERDGKRVGRVSNAVQDPDSGAHYAPFLEFGTEHMDAQRVLGRSLDVLRGP